METGEPTGGERELPLSMETEQDAMGPDKGQGVRRRKFCEDVTGDRERKCSKIQVQKPTLRQIQSKEAVGEMDTGECLVGENYGNERGGGGRVLEKVKSILQGDKGRGEKGSEGGEVGEWIQVKGKGKGRKGSL